MRSRLFVEAAETDWLGLVLNAEFLNFKANLQQTYRGHKEVRMRLTQRHFNTCCLLSAWFYNVLNLRKLAALSSGATAARLCNFAVWADQ